MLEKVNLTVGNEMHEFGFCNLKVHLLSLQSSILEGLCSEPKFKSHF